MVHFLRNNKNRTIVECEVYNSDLHSATDIEVYSNMLLSLDEWDEQKEFINDIAYLDELRGIWWEHLETRQTNETMEKFVENEFKRIADKWYLTYITD